MNKSHAVKGGSKDNWLSIEMRLYVAKAITNSGREIKCEQCGAYENLEFHHTKYSPQEEVTIKDIRLLCCKCHRNSKVAINKASQLKTVFENGQRFCLTDRFKFPY